GKSCIEPDKNSAALFLSPPILFRLALHRRRRRVLELEPVPRFDEAGRRQTGTRQHGKNEIPCCVYVGERKRHPLGTDLYRLRHGLAGPPRRKVREVSSEGSETSELSLLPLFEEYHAQSWGVTMMPTVRSLVARVFSPLIRAGEGQPRSGPHYLPIS